jgi:hypothetical protein
MPQRFATLHFGAAPPPPAGMLLSTTKVTVSVMRVDDSALPAERVVDRLGETSPAVLRQNPVQPETGT